MRILVEQCQKININEVMKEAKTELIAIALQSKITALGQVLDITSTPCHFGNKRFWFACPSCRRRVGTLYKPPAKTVLLCRRCHDLSYLKSRYKGMLKGIA